MSRVPPARLSEDNLFQFAKLILDDTTLSTEQAAKRLNLLTAFVDDSTPATPLPIAFSFGAIEQKNMLLHLLATTDAPSIQWDSAPRMLDTALRIVESKQKGAPSRPLHTSQTPQAFTQRLAQVAALYKNDLLDLLADTLLAIPGFTTGHTPENARKLLLDYVHSDPTFSAVFDMQLTIVDHLQSLRYDNLQTAIEWTTFAIFERVITNPGMISAAFPSFTTLAPTVDCNAFRAQNPSLVPSLLTGRDILRSERFEAADLFVGDTFSRSTDAENVTSGFQCMRGDVLRSFALTSSELLSMTPEERLKNTCNYTVVDRNGTHQVLTPFAVLGSFLDETVRIHNLQWESLPQDQRNSYSGVIDAYLGPQFAQWATDAIRPIAASEKQLAATLMALNQAQDGDRNFFEFMGGSFYNKTVYRDDFDHIHIIRQTRESDPLQYKHEVIVAPHGSMRFNADSYRIEYDEHRPLSTAPQPPTQHVQVPVGPVTYLLTPLSKKEEGERDILLLVAGNNPALDTKDHALLAEIYNVSRVLASKIQSDPALQAERFQLMEILQDVIDDAPNNASLIESFRNMGLH